MEQRKLRQKTRQDQKYRPAPFNNKDWKHVEATSSQSPAYWVKKAANGAEIKLNEYVIPKLGRFQPDSGYDYWQGSLERTHENIRLRVGQERVP